MIFDALEVAFGQTIQYVLDFLKEALIHGVDGSAIALQERSGH